jgi:GT2 family glycosyltransferase
MALPIYNDFYLIESLLEVVRVSLITQNHRAEKTEQRNMQSVPTQPSLPPTSLIICSRNRPRLLWQTIDSVLQGEEVPSEIVIIDQSDKEDSELRAMKYDRLCQIHYCWSRSLGLCRARNLGVEAAANDILAFTDDDVCVTANWFGTLVRALIQAGPRVVVTGRVLPGAEEAKGGFVPALVTGEEPRVYQGRIGTDVLAGLHMAMCRSTICEVGEFDERLGAGSRFESADDNDYGFRLLESGYRIAYVPEAVIYHRAWRSERDYFRMRWAYGRGKGGFYVKYLSLRDPYMAQRMGRDIGISLVRFPWRVLHRPRLAIGDLVYDAGVLSGAVEWSLAHGKGTPLRH